MPVPNLLLCFFSPCRLKILATALSSENWNENPNNLPAFLLRSYILLKLSIAIFLMVASIGHMILTELIQCYKASKECSHYSPSFIFQYISLTSFTFRKEISYCFPFFIKTNLFFLSNVFI